MTRSRIDVADDYGNSATAANVGVVGSDANVSGADTIVNGYIASGGDHDFFKVWLNAGNYSIVGHSVESNALPTGRAVAQLALAPGVTKSALIQAGQTSHIFSVSTAGYYSVDVYSSCYLCSGNYSFEVKSVDMGAIYGIVDAPAAPGFAQALTINTALEGQLNVAHDSDAFKVSLEKGKRYYFTMDSDSSYQGGNGGAAHVGYGIVNANLSLYASSWNGSGAALRSGEDTQLSYDDCIIYEAAATGDHYLVAKATGWYTTGDYKVSYGLLTQDDWVDNQIERESLSMVIPGVPPYRDFYPDQKKYVDYKVVKVNEAPTSGVINYPKDTDEFGVTLQGGVTYLLRVNSFSSLNNPGLGNPVLSLLTDNGSYPEIITYNDNKKGDPIGAGSGAQVKDSLIVITPAKTTKYGLWVGGVGNTTGQYQVSVTAWDDVVGSTATSQRVFINGGSVNGHIEIAGDTDWFSVYLSAGTTYTFDLRIAAANGLSNPLLYLRDGNGVAVAVNDNNDGLDSQIRFTASQSGMYFLDVQDATKGYGKYTVSAQADDDHAATVKTAAILDLASSAGVSGRIDFGGDVDWIAVDLELNQTYGVHVFGTESGKGLTLADPRLLGIYDAKGVMVHNSGNDDHGDSRDSYLRFSAQAAGRYFIAVAGSTLEDLGSYSLQINQQSTPDTAEGVLTRATLAVGDSVLGSIETAGDKDWYSVQLTAGTTYAIDLLGDATSTNVLRDVMLGGIYDASGAFISGTSNNNYGASLNSKLLFTASATSTYFVEAKGNATHRGDYQLSIKPLTTTEDAIGSSVATDDHGQLTLIDGAGKVTGLVDVARDVDWFKVTLAHDKTYDISLRGAASGKGTLLDPRFYGIYDAAGKLIIGTSADGGDGGVDVRSTFAPLITGVYYLAAGGTADMAGSYELEVRTIVPTNDVASNISTTASVISGAAYVGELETVGDSDWIRVDLAANQRVMLELTGVRGSLGKLANPEIANVFNSRGEAVLLDSPFIEYSYDNGVYAPGYDVSANTNYLERKSFFSSQAGTYYVEVQSYVNGIGDYRLKVSEEADKYLQNEAERFPYPELLGSYIDHNAKLDTFYSRNVAVDGVITLRFGVSDAWAANTKHITIPVDMAKGSGNIYISSAGQLLTIDVNSDQVHIYGNEVVINPEADFLPNQDYVMFMDSGVLTDAGGVAFQGIGVERTSKYWGLTEAWSTPGYNEYMWVTEKVNDPNEFLFRTAGQKSSPKDAWTLMVYMAADNELEAQAIVDLKEMFAANLPDDVNVVVMVDRANGYDASEGNWTGAYRGQVQQGMTVQAIASDWENLGEVNTGDWSTLKGFIDSVKANPGYAAQRYGLVIWGPGGGITGTAWDYSANLDNLSLSELNSAFNSSNLQTTVSFAENIVAQPESYSRVDTSQFRLTAATLAESRSAVLLDYSLAVYDPYESSESVRATNPLLGAFKFSVDDGVTWRTAADWKVWGNTVTLDLGMTVDSGQTLRVAYDSAYRPVYKHDYIAGFGEWWNSSGSTTPNSPSMMEAATAAPRPAEFAAIRSYSGEKDNQWANAYTAASFDLTISDKKLDLLAFDSSTMGLVETLWQISGNAHTLVASEDTVPATGFDYKNWLEALARNSDLTGGQLAHELVDTYFAQNAGGINASIASYDLDALQISQHLVNANGSYNSSYGAGYVNLLHDINQFASYALQNGTASDWRIIKEAALNVKTAPTHDAVVDYFRDLSDFLQYLTKHLGAGSLKDHAREAYLTVLATATYAKTGDSGSVGLGIYLPVNSPVDPGYIDDAAGAGGTNNNFLFLASTYNGSAYPQWDEFVQKVQVEITNTAPGALVVTPLAASGAGALVAEVVSVTGKLEQDLQVATLSYTDTDGWTQTNVYEITGPDSARLRIIGDGLYLRAGTDLDYESATNTDRAYTVSVTVKDPTLPTPSGAGATQSITVQVTNVDEQAPVIGSPASARVVESAANNPQVYQATASDDMGSGQLRFSLKPADDFEAFAINALTGAVSFKGVLDYEVRDLYRFTVVAEDASGKRAEQTVDFKVGNADDGGADTRGPQAIHFTPADNASAVALNSSIVVAFNEPIRLGAGSIVLKTLSGQAVETFSASASSGLSIDNSDSEKAKLTINPGAQLSNNTTYVLEFQANSVLDATGNGMAAKADYNFRTIKGIAGVTTNGNDTEGASASGLVLPAGLQAQPLEGDIVLRLSEAVQRGVGSIKLVRHYQGAPDQIVETFDAASSPQLAIDAAAKTLTINPTHTLKAGTSYSVLIEPAALLDAAGNPMASGANQLAFTAAAGSGFDIELVFESTTVAGGWTEALKKPYRDAVQRLEEIIVGDLPDVRDAQGNLIVDDLLIRINELERMDKMGEGGPTALRSSASGGLASQGFVNMDRAEVADIAKAFAASSSASDLQAMVDHVMTETIIHEIAHVLGMGSLWSQYGFNAVRGQYTGPQALAAYRLMVNDPSAPFVPLDLSGMPGTDNAHWSEEIFGTEMMTGFYRSPGLPVSQLTIAGLADLGYEVDFAAADEYSVAGAAVQPILNAANTGATNLYMDHSVI